MKSTSALAMAAVFCALALGIGARADALTPTLKIGDPAPPLQPMSWLKGEPIAQFEPGRVYVVEFWATWCVPCKEQMPHLSALQKSQAQRLTVVGVNVREAERGKAVADAVRKFVDKQGERMAYTVAMDDPEKKTVFNTWMTAAGAYGLPTSFVVDGKGRVVWVGHPVGARETAFDTAVQQALAGHSDLAAGRDAQKEANQETAARLGK
jgi:thiol-disulfide isomerase/thioredoxin